MSLGSVLRSRSTSYANGLGSLPGLAPRVSRMDVVSDTPPTVSSPASRTARLIKRRRVMGFIWSSDLIGVLARAGPTRQSHGRGERHAAHREQPGVPHGAVDKVASGDGSIPVFRSDWGPCPGWPHASVAWTW